MSLRGNRKSVVASEFLFRRELAAEIWLGGGFGSCGSIALQVRERILQWSISKHEKCCWRWEASPGRWKGENYETNSHRVLHK